MKKLIRFVVRVIFATSTFCIAGCCGGDSADDIAEKYVERLKAADFDTMRQMSTGGMILWIDRAERKYDEIARLLGEDEANEFRETYDEVKYEIGESVSDDAKMTVSVKINGQSTTMTLIKRSGKWRIEKFDFPII